MDNKRKIKITFGIISIVAVLVISIAIFYENGFRIALSGISRTGSIELFVPNEGSSVFLDSKNHTITTLPHQIVLLEKLNQGEHSIIVSKNNYWPWAKTISLPQNTDLKMKTFTIAMNPNITTLNPTSELSSDLLSKFSKYKLPTENNPLVKTEHDIAISLSSNERIITAHWLGTKEAIPQQFCSKESCSESIIAFESNKPILSIIFMNTRDDVLIMSLGSDVYALEITPLEQKNFQPIYKGVSPRILDRDERSIFIQDQSNILVVQF